MDPAVAVGTVVVVAALAGWQILRLRRPRLAALKRVAGELGRGNLGARVDTQGSPAYRSLAESLNAMAESLERRMGELEKERDLHAGALRGIREGLVVLDHQQVILLANPAMGELLDCDPRRAAGMALWEVIRSEEVSDGFREVVASGRPQVIQVGPIKERHLSFSFSPLGPEGPVAVVIHDTTESARYQELRKEFVANVSHELRTPLTIIRGFVETLEDGAIREPDRAAEFLGMISKHTRQLTNLVENLLDLSRLEGAQALQRRVRVDLVPLLGRVIDFQMPAAQKRGQTLTLTAPRFLPSILGDPDYLERAVSNLVDNAIKYTPEGGSIRVAAGADGKSVAVEVVDNGIGIPEADLPRVFERFYRVDKSRSRDMGGTGLGLAIVKHVVQSHGGVVEAKSTPGRGTTFRMTLPAEKADATRG
ncbi:MAG TPA: ATP-binding protein [Planctomycetota bacterium]|nr:ATP-binding protein [Planctomycetota bacterium]